MIPRLRPQFSPLDLCLSAIHSDTNNLEKFEKTFAEKFEFQDGVFFQFGRAALFALLSTQGWRDRIVSMPAYTCVVVPHAVKISGNRVHFLDSGGDHFNVPANRWQSIPHETKMAVPTPIFGYPVDAQTTTKIKNAAPDVFILNDLAHGFTTTDTGGLQCRDADAALFGLGVGKIVSSIYGGMLLLRDSSLSEAVRRWRDTHCAPTSWRSTLKHLIYGIAVRTAFQEPALSLAHILETKTNLLDPYTSYYYGKDGIHLPESSLNMPTQLQAHVGAGQLNKIDASIEARQNIGRYYETRLKELGIPVFSWSEMPTWSQFPLMVSDRDCVISKMAHHGVQLGQLIDYSCPDIQGYETERSTMPCPKSAEYGRSMVNLPIWPGISRRQLDKVVETLAKLRDDGDIFVATN